MSQPTFLIASVPPGTYQIDVKSEQFTATWTRIEALSREATLQVLASGDLQKLHTYLTQIASDFPGVLTTLDRVGQLPANELPDALRIALITLVGSVQVMFGFFQTLCPAQAAPLAEAFKLKLDGLKLDEVKLSGKPA